MIEILDEGTITTCSIESDRFTGLFKSVGIQ